MDSHGSSSDAMQKVLDRLDGFGTEFKTLSTEFSTFSTQVQTDFTQLNGNIHSLSGDVVGLRSDVTALRSDVTALRTDVTALSKKVGSMDMDVSRLVETSARHYIIETQGHQFAQPLTFITLEDLAAFVLHSEYHQVVDAAALQRAANSMAETLLGSKITSTFMWNFHEGSDLLLRMVQTDPCKSFGMLLRNHHGAIRMNNGNQKHEAISSKFQSR